MDDSRASKSVAVVGYACRFAGADDVETFWTNLVEGTTSFREVPADRWDHSQFHSEHSREHDKTYVQRGAFMDDVSSFAAMHFGVAPRRVEVMDPQHRLVLDAVRVALQDAGMERGGYDPKMVGTFLGVSTSEYRNLVTSRTMAMLMSQGNLGAESDHASNYAIGKSVENVSPISAFSMPGTLLNMAAANVAHQWKFGGPAYTVDAACASSLVAVHDAIVNIRAGICDMAVAGGVYLNLTPESLVGFSRIGAISRSGECRPFDAAADGFLQGDGCGVLVLKRLDLAVADGDRIHAVIRGTGINNDGDTTGPMAPAVEGQTEVIRRAWADAGLDPTEEVGYVECHGTATAVGDPVEVGALREVLGDDGPAVNVGSVKANIGHTMSAAGVAGLLKAILAVEHGWIPAQPGFETPNEVLELDRSRLAIDSAGHAWSNETPRRAGVSAFGFGGTNCHMVVEAAPESTQPEVPAAPQLVVLSAGNHALLAKHASRVADAVEESNDGLADIAYSLTQARSYEASRLAIVANSRGDLVDKLRDAAGRIEAGVQSAVLGPDVFVTAEDLSEARIALMFPGQGAQRVGLLRDAYDRFDAFRQRLDRLMASVDDCFDKPLIQYLYPDLSDGDFDRESAELKLEETHVCQAVMAALGLAFWGFLRDELGVSADVTLGHSLGEFVAVAAAGMTDDESLLKLVCKRGRVMAELDVEDRGAMAAIMGDVDTVRPLLNDTGLQIANRNHPQQTVVSGPTSAIEELVGRLEEAGTKATRLRVSHAFHSSVVEGIGAELEAEIARLDFCDGDALAVSAIDVGGYTPKNAAEIFRRHATAPVDFIGALEHAHHAGATIFLEAGAGTTLTRFASKTLGDIDARSLACADADENREFFRTLAWLAASGIELELRGLLNPTERRRVVTLPATPLETQTYWVTRDRKTPLAIAREAEEHIQANEKPMSTDPSKNSPETSMNGSSPNGTSPSASFHGAQSQEGLVELFRQQNEILREHARIMAAQAQALGYEASDLHIGENGLGSMASSTSVGINGATNGAGPAPVAVRHGANVVSKSAEVAVGGTVDGEASPDQDEEQDFRAIVFNSVADVSAFPVDALKDSQELAADLGFDSLMFVDLATVLQGSIDGLGQIPQDAFDQKTTLGDVVAFLKSHVGSVGHLAADDAGEASTQASSDQTLKRFATTLVKRRRPKLPPRADLSAARLVVVADEAVPSGLLTALEEQHEVAVATPDSAVDAIEDTRATGIFWWLGTSCDDELEVYVRAHQLAAALAEVDSTPELFVLASNVGHEASLSGQVDWLEGLRSFARSVAREWKSTRVKCIDTADESTFIDEVLSASNEVVVRYDSEGSRWVDALAEQPFAPSDDAPLHSEDVVLMTGATGGVGAIITREIAQRSGACLVLVGRTERDELSDDVKAHLETLKGSGSSVEYVSWDVMNHDAPARLSEVFEAVGQPTVFIHAAGLTRDCDLASKSTEDIELVTGVKTLGFDHVMAALSEDTLRHIVAFTSWTGVFGNRSQSDYAIANAALDARTAKLRARGLNARSIAWPAWESTEMVQKNSKQVRDYMKNEGVSFIDDETGAAAFFDELATESDEATLLYGYRVPEETRSVDTRFKVSLESHPYLRDHVLRDKPVMPFASALDYLATAGIETTNLEGPFAIEDFSLSRGIEVERPVTLHLRSRASTRDGRPEARIEVKAQVEGQRDAFVAYGGRFIGTSSDEVVDFIAESPNTTEGCDSRMDLQNFYDDYSFHGPTIQAITAIEEVGDGHAVGRLRTSRPADLLDSPTREVWTVDPRILDGALQLTLYYLQSRHGVAAYPTGFSRYVQLRPIVESEVRVTLVRHEMTDERILGSLKIQTLDGEVLAVMSNLSARVFEVKKRLGASDSQTNEVGADDGPEVDEIHWNVSKFPEVEALEQRLQMADLIGISNPYFAVHDGVAKNKAIINGSEMINFSSYNYLGFSGHPEVSKAAKDAVDRYGTSVSASRVASGQIPLHSELEDAISKFMGVEAALVFSAGHHTNESVIGHLFNEGDLIIHDSLAHNSILTGAELSGAKRMKFPHNDHKALEKLLKQLRGSYNKVGIMIEGVYSMDGDIPDLPAFIALKKKYKSLLYVDEAHSAGCIGPRGAGVADYFGIDPMEVDVWMGTLSKSFSSCGGYCAGSEQLIQYLKYTVPGFIFSAGISPANAAAALAAIRLADAHPEVVHQLQERSKFFLERCKANGLDTGPSQDSAVVPVVVGNSMECLKLSEALGKRGINVQPIVYPAVDDDAARLRFFMSATHEEDELAFTADTVAEELTRIQSGAAAE